MIWGVFPPIFGNMWQMVSMCFNVVICFQPVRWRGVLSSGRSAGSSNCGKQNLRDSRLARFFGGEVHAPRKKTQLSVVKTSSYINFHRSAVPLWSSVLAKYGHLPIQFCTPASGILHTKLGLLRKCQIWGTHSWLLWQTKIGCFNRLINNIPRIWNVSTQQLDCSTNSTEGS